MNRLAAALGSAVFFVIAPGSIAGYGPWAISGWRVRAVSPALQDFGVILILAGLAALVECFARFVWRGRGTPAPIAPPRSLVVSGLYRRTRNPMYVAIVTTILGQAALFGDIRLVAYAAVVWAGFHLWVLVYEEPALRRAFPGEYAAYAAAVPRWRPRLRAWRGA